MKEKEETILVGDYRNLPEKKPSWLGNAQQKGARDDYIERRREQEMVRDLQGIFCTGRYRSWRPSRKAT
jgi:hypothetical protein